MAAIFATGYSQDVSIDQLTAPASPGFTILGKEVTNIEKPSTSTDLIVSFRNSTGDFSTLPKNFAIEFFPYWVLGGNKKEFKDLSSDKVSDNIPQTLQLSFATQTIEKSNSLGDSTQMGIGFKFSIFRGTINDDFNTLQKKLYSKLKTLNAKKASDISEIEKNDPEIQKINEAINSSNDDDELERLMALKDQRLNVLLNQNSETDLETELSALAKSIKFTRYGWKLDVAGAWAVSFPTQDFDNREVNRFAIWVNGGYETKKDAAGGHWSILGVIRYLQNYSEPFKDANDQLVLANNRYTDIGVRAIHTFKDKVSLSAEIINRENRDEEKPIKSSIRYSFNLNYQLPDNTIVSFTYGKDFDGAIKKDGNLIASLNLIKGLGSKRPIQ